MALNRLDELKELLDSLLNNIDTWNRRVARGGEGDDSPPAQPA